MGHMTRRLAAWMRKWADRIDLHGAPRRTSWSFTFEHNDKGIQYRDDGKGCPLWYYGQDDFHKAFTDSDS